MIQDVSFWGLVGSIPDVIWSGVIASVLTLSGVFFADLRSSSRFTKQLAHEAQQNDRDRLAALRRDVYLQAPKEAIKALHYIGQLSRRDLRGIGDDEGILGYAAVSAQIGVLSEVPTVEAVAKLGNLLTRTLAHALRDLQEVQDSRTDISIGQERLDFLRGDTRRIQAEQQSMSELGLSDERRSAGLGYWCGVRQEEANVLSDRLNKLRAENMRQIFDYHKNSLENLPVLTDAMTDVMRCVRKEIGLTHDLDEYEASMRAMSAELRQDLLKMLSGLVDGMDEKPLD